MTNKKYGIRQTKKFKRDLKLARKRGYNLDLLDAVVEKIARGEKLPERYCDHALTGDWLGFRECHIKPDWLLIYRIENELLLLMLWRTGTHSDLKIK